MCDRLFVNGAIMTEVPDVDYLSQRPESLSSAEKVWLESTREGTKVRVELYNGSDCAATVKRWTVRRLHPGLYRAVVLHNFADVGQLCCFACDSSMESCASFLRNHGVPALRIGSALIS